MVVEMKDVESAVTKGLSDGNVHIQMAVVDGLSEFISSASGNKAIQSAVDDMVAAWAKSMGPIGILVKQCVNMSVAMSLIQWGLKRARKRLEAACTCEK